jgi:small-conductance mechanosensitive channel
MSEEIDALQALDISLGIFLILGLLTLGIALEVLLRIIRRWTISKNKPHLTMIVNAFTWQPLAWSLIIGIAWPASLLLNRLSSQEADQELVLTLFAISTTIIILRLLRGWMRILTETRPAASVSLLKYLVTGAGIVIIVLIIAGYLLDIPIQTLIFWLILGLFALIFAFRDPLNNVLSGLALTLSQRLEVGDFIRLPSGNEGRIEDIQWDVTTIRQINGVLTIVPNIVIGQAEIINYARPGPYFQATIDIGVSYESDLQQVEEITLEVVEAILQTANEDRTAEPKPFIRYTGFDESNINYRLYIPARRLDEQILLKHEIVKQLHLRYREAGVVISYPRVTLNYADHPSSTGKLWQSAAKTVTAEEDKDSRQ